MPDTCLELAKLQAGAALWIGNDSGPSHLAGLLGIPTLTLYKWNNIPRWGVRGRQARNLQAKDETQALRVIQAALREPPLNAGIKFETAMDEAGSLAFA
jgi:ADP-heptose:LPS heptosyltransferase